ncbi:hypothetical protein BH18ACT15_BH18ACT15_03500 [soil metagenome]
MELSRARNDIDAHLLTGRLAEAGIETRKIKQRGSSPSWLIGGSDPWAPVTVLVRRFELDEARLVLAELSWRAPAAGARQTPDAHRPRHVIWWAAALGLGILLTAGVLAEAAGAMQQSCARGPACAGARP